jgi:SHS2 domain-containing protein
MLAAMVNEEQLIHDQIRATGASAEEVFRAAQAAGLDVIFSLRAVRGVFSMSLPEAMQVKTQVENTERPLSASEQVLLPLLTEALHQSFER